MLKEQLKPITKITSPKLLFRIKEHTGKTKGVYQYQTSVIRNVKGSSIEEDGEKNQNYKTK